MPITNLAADDQYVERRQVAMMAQHGEKRLRICSSFVVVFCVLSAVAAFSGTWEILMGNKVMFGERTWFLSRIVCAYVVDNVLTFPS